MTVLALEDDWIVCLGQTRPVVAGRVACPDRAELMPLAVCLDCRHLAWRVGERDRPDPCSTEPAG
jgi:hypothetical protein